MVYAVRSNKAFIAKGPLKTKRVQSEHSKQLEQFMRTHKITVSHDSFGKPVVTAEEIKDE